MWMELQPGSCAQVEAGTRVPKDGVEQVERRRIHSSKPRYVIPWQFNCCYITAGLRLVSRDEISCSWRLRERPAEGGEIPRICLEYLPS